MAPTFRTNNGLIRYAREDASFPGYPKPVPAWKDMRIRSEGFGFQEARIPIGNLSAGNQPNPDLKGNITVEGELELRWEPTVHPLFLAHFQEGEKTVVDLVGAFAAGTLDAITIADTNTVTIGGKVYTAESVLTNVDGHFLVGASDSDSIDNLIAAVNLGAGSGTLYAAATTLHPTVTASAGALDTMVATAKTKGVAGNAITTVDGLTAGSWAAATLLGGIDSAYTHKLAPNEDDISHDVPFSLRVWRDDGLPVTIIGCRVPAWSISGAVGGGPVQGGVTVMGRAFTYYGGAVGIEETGSPTKPVILGLPTYDNWVLADNQLRVKVISVGPTTVKVKRGAASTYDGAAITVTAATEITLTDEGDDPLGPADTPVILYAANLTGWTVNNEWSFAGDEAEAPWEPSYPVVEALNVLNISLLVNGVERCSIQSIETTGEVPIDPAFGLSCGAMSPGLVQEGDRIIGGTLEGRYVANDLKKMREADEPITLVVTYGSNTDIGSGSATKYQIKQTHMRVFLTGPSPTLSPGPFREPWGFRAYNSDDVTYPDDVTFEVQNNDSDFTA